ELHRTGLPDVLANEEPDAESVALDDGWYVARTKVALLVEHLVVRQLRLAMIRDQLAAVEERRGIVDFRADVFGIADDHADVPHLLPDTGEPRLDLAAEAAVKEQVLRRIAG